MRGNDLHGHLRRLLWHEQVMLNIDYFFTDNRQLSFDQAVLRVINRALSGVFNRNQTAVGLALRHGGKDIVDGTAGKLLALSSKAADHSSLRKSPWRAEVSNFLRLVSHTGRRMVRILGVSISERKRNYF